MEPNTDRGLRAGKVQISFWSSNIFGISSTQLTLRSLGGGIGELSISTCAQALQAKPEKLKQPTASCHVLARGLGKPHSEETELNIL
jgi:hypothetical protein